MSRSHVLTLLKKEVARIDGANTSKRNEKIIEGFTKESSPKALINGKKVRIFNSNDYLGLRHNSKLKRAESEASEKYGTGPGAVRFISGSLKIYRDLEKKIAEYHSREDSMIFSSAFAANMAVIFCLIIGQSKDSVVDNNVLVISDALNHRSIIDGIRIANLAKEQKAIFRHMDVGHLEQLLKDGKGKYKRAMVITDGVFSMLGEFQKLKEIRTIVDKYDSQYEMGVLLIVDDAHGVGVSGKSGRGVEEVEGAHSDVLVGTLGKGFGSDGGYVVADKRIINYLRESAATYIYSNPFAPGTAGASLKALELLDSNEGKKLLLKSQKNIEYFKKAATKSGLKFAVNSQHAIQPVLIGDPIKTRKIVEMLFKQSILVTQISYPVVSKGADEIRVQISAAHEKEDIDYLIKNLTKAAKELKII